MLRKEKIDLIDQKFDQMFDNLHNHHQRVSRAAELCYVRNVTLVCFAPNTPDYEYCQKRYEEAQQRYWSI